MRYIVFISFAVGISIQILAQTPQNRISSTPREDKQATINFLLTELAQAHQDTIRLRIMDSLSMYYLYYSIETDSSLFYSDSSIQMALNLENKRPLILAYARRSNYFWQKTNMKASLESAFRGIQLSTEFNIPDYLSTHYNNIVNIYGQYANFPEILKNTKLQVEYLRYNKDPFFDQPLLVLANEGNAYLIEGKPDSALITLAAAHEKGLNSKDQNTRDIILWYTARAFNNSNKYKQADSVFRVGMLSCILNFDNQILNAIYAELAENYLEQNQLEGAITYALLGLNNAMRIKDHFSTFLCSDILANCYEQLGMPDSTLHFVKFTNKMKDSLFNSNKISAMQEVVFSEQIRQKEKQSNDILEREKQKSRLRTYGFFAALVVFLLIAWIMWRNSKQKEKSYALLQKQKEETEKQKLKAEQTLEELKTAQAQLIQSEKMASLGDLTAGIAHEIQNPLNFVNNFAEVNSELIKELIEEIKEGDFKSVNSIASDIQSNSEKIYHHGQRADSIVKSMLLHTRNSSGQKELVDLNALCDEYLRLAYHGLRAKDKSFDSSYKTMLDATVPKIKVIPQDIGRVLLNLINNAFQAVQEKKKSATEEMSYSPEVVVSTQFDNGKILISVKDNGHGIPEEIRDKIFQPFFTTRPTGQGTGLGLSLAYDIVKAHAGNLTVRSLNENKENNISTQPIKDQENKGLSQDISKNQFFTEFTISLPIN